MAPNAAVDRVLTCNGGSSSIKFALFSAGDPPERLLWGKVERLGAPGAELKVEDHTGVLEHRTLFAHDPEGAVEEVLEYLSEDAGACAVGHRVVRGGPEHLDPKVVTSELIEDLRRFQPYDPEHLPAEIALIEGIARRHPDIAQVACFDTAFHRDLPTVARLLPIPRRYVQQGIRRYGFHGLSYAYLMEELARTLGEDVARSRVVLAHLGNGASMAAVKNGKSIDTTMGFTPTAGLVMSSRSGDVDPGLVSYFGRTEGMTAEQFHHMASFESGLIGISETSSDMRDLLKAAAKDERAADAVDLFCYQARKWIGALAAALGGLDVLVFSGGIGENSPEVRARICSELGFLGIEIDDARNSANETAISKEGGRALVRVIKTDEETTIAKTVLRVLGVRS
jgi:acetate kinase